jgi:diguanylate cyclase (GGDEF)-like protein/PAS domain S-box-containing protein
MAARQPPTSGQGRVRHRPWVVACVAFVLSCTVTALVVRQQATREQAMEREHAVQVAKEHGTGLEHRLKDLTTSLYLLESLVRQSQGQAIDYAPAMANLLPHFPGVTSLALAPDGVVSHVAPLQGNEASIGLNLLTDPRFNAGALEAKASEQMVVDGPFELVQGGWGIVARLPIYLPQEQNHVFWGLANVVIRLNEAFTSFELGDLPQLGYDYRLWLQPPGSETRQVLLSSVLPSDHLAASSIDHTLRVADKQWVLSLYPIESSLASRITNHYLIGLLISILIAFVSKLLMEQRLHRQFLQEQVEERTRDIRATQQQLKATLQAIPDLLFEVDLTGRLHLVHTQAPEALLAPPEQLVGRNQSEFLPPEALKVANEALQEAHATGHSLGKQYVLEIDDQAMWFELSVSRKVTPEGETPRFIALARDITARKHAETQSALATEFFHGSNEGFVITDASQKIIQVNPAFTEITGYTLAEAIGKTPKMLSSGRQSANFYRQMWEQLSTEGQWQGEIWNRRKSGELYPEWLSISRIQGEDGQTSHFIAIFSDNTRRREQEARIRSLAYFDPLTGLANRTLLKDRVQHDLSQARRRHSPLSLLFIDLDHFKHINDSLGHRAGDEVLKQVSERLTRLVREQDTISRLGGDEFVALLPDTDAEGASHVARNLLDSLARPYLVDQQELTVTPSIGIALSPDDGDDFDALYRCADTAMYRAKQEGRNGFCFFTPEMQEQSIRRLQLENALRRALEREQLSLHFQPQLSLQSDAIVGVEVLLRWKHPEWGMVSPAEFIPIAESSGLILTIGEWVLRQACVQAKQWLNEGLPPLVIAVNLSAAQFRHPQLPEMVSGILQETGLPAPCLELELTESAAMHDPEAAIATMNALHQQGVLMSVDDFGTGYSSLNYLKRFQVYKLKIDQSFVKDVLEDPEDASIVNTVIKMAHSLGLVTIAEGVETREQLEFLRSQGCEEIQGYFLARPLPAKDFESWLRNRLSGRG